MPRADQTEAVAEVVSLADLAETLERMGQGLADLFTEVTGERAGRALASCVLCIEQVSTALRGFARLYDPDGAHKLALESRDFRSVADRISRTIGELAKANEDIATRLGERVRELGELAGMPAGQAVGPRLQSTVARVRTLAGRLQQNLRRISDHVDRANQGLSALEHEFQEARQKAALDALTRLYSRAALDGHLDAAIELGRASDHWSLLLIDIDHFKRVNDAHGHLVGDALLYRVARVLERSLRGKGSGDFLARYGGEEFAVVLVGADLEAASRVAERLRANVAAARWQPKDGAKDVVIQVTVSVGVSEFHDGDTVLSLLKRADRALYRAKREGRNCVVAEDA